jgi:hypothetical protein
VAIRGLKTSGIVSFTTSQVAALGYTQLSALSSSQIGIFDTLNFSSFATSAIQGITSTSIKGLTTAQIVALTTSQASAFTSLQLRAMSSSQLSAFETQDLAVLTTSAIAALSSASIGGLTTTQILSLTTSQVSAMTPLVLDLHDDGINTTLLSNGTMFDLGNTGQAIWTSWITQGDGLLVRDLNADGIINNGGELFGEGTVLANGKKAKDGYQALQPLDTNHDSVINEKDQDFNQIGVWVDNGDGITQSVELHSLTQLGITSISLNVTQSSEVNNGNLIGLMGSYKTDDGKTHTMGDVWFSVDIAGHKVFDLAAVIEKSGGISFVDLKDCKPAKLNVALNDVLSLGQYGVNGLSTVKIDGDAGDTVQLTQGGDGWSQHGTVTEGEESYDVYVNQDAQLLVNHNLYIVLI